MVVLDTSTLIYWTLDRVKLSSRAEKTITTADRILVSSISIWEIGIKIKKGKLAIPLPIRTYVEKLKLVDRLEIAGVSEEIWIINLELTWKHKDPADRTIVATAVINDSPLVTPDRTIKRFYERTIW